MTSATPDPSAAPGPTSWRPEGQSGRPGAGQPLAAPPVTTTADDEGSGHVAPPPAGRHRRRPWAVITLSVALVLVTALASYLWVRTVRYEEYAAGIEEQARGIGTDLTTLRQEHDGTVAELAAVNEQLTTAQDRITALADEKAQIGDDREVQRQLVDYQQRISEAAANVASALSTCIDGQNQLITYLQDTAAYDPTELEGFKSDVQRVCGAATDANTQLQQELTTGTDG